MTLSSKLTVWQDNWEFWAVIALLVVGSVAATYAIVRNWIPDSTNWWMWTLLPVVAVAAFNVITAKTGIINNYAIVFVVSVLVLVAPIVVAAIRLR